MLLLSKIFLILLISISISYAEDETDYILDSSKESTVILNDNLRKTARRIREVENLFPLPISSTTGILSVARGGTGADNSAIAQGYIPYISSTGVISWLATGTSGQVLKTNGAAANPSWTTDTPYVSGTNHTLINSTTEVIGGAQVTTPTKLKEIRVGKDGSVSVTFEFLATTGTESDPDRTAYGRIYVNGSAVGTTRSTMSSSYTTPAAETISGLVANDLVQFYGWTSGGGSNACKVRSFKLQVEAGLSTITLE